MAAPVTADDCDDCDDCEDCGGDDCGGDAPQRSTTTACAATLAKDCKHFVKNFDFCWQLSCFFLRAAEVVALHFARRFFLPAERVPQDFGLSKSLSDYGADAW